jgi:RsiW-degrading membrane proteinase PrsW (M82 family)
MYESAMEAVLKYYPAIYQQRHHGCSSTNDDDISTATNGLPHQRRDGTVMGHPLSLLSYRILQALVLFCFLMLLWSYGGSYYFSYIVGRHSHQQHQFEFLDCCLMILTFLQSFTLLGIWAFFINRTKSSELSFDAIIKYFASGFFLSASLALFWEMMSAAVINTFVSLLLAVLGIDRVENPQTDQTWQKPFGSATFFSSISNSPTLMSRLCWSNISGMNGEMSVKRPDYASVFGMDHPMLYTIYILIATFVVAGFIEELCKYFGYRMVEHPDFFSREELEEASIILENNHDEDMDEDDGSIHPSRSRPTVTNFSKQGQSVQARGAAITLAMVSVAIGFACCENLIYIFFYAGNSLLLELGVLIERSCFPVHPILAAIQSIGVCERELEGSRSMKLGRIILPAVLFHGAFDFFIIFISFMGRLVGQGVEDGDLKISNTAEFLSVVSCVVIMFASSLYLYNESGKQRERLVAIDVQATIDRSSLI